MREPEHPSFPERRSPGVDDPLFIHSPWGDHPVEPTDLLALWSAAASDAAPTLAQVAALFDHHLSQWLDVNPVIKPNPKPVEDPRVQWSALLEFPSGAQAILWCEPMRDMPAEHIKLLKIEGVKWVIGAETVLDPAHPLDDFVALLKTLARGIPDSPAILNVNTECWHVRQELEEVVFAHGIDPGMGILWLVHATGASAEPDAPVWLYTRGLARCGRPELEMLGVPVSSARQAGALLNTIAELIMESGLPEPGARLEIGQDLDITLHPWREVAAALPDTLPGSPHRRQMHDGQVFAGAGAVVCADEPMNGQWRWPAEVIERISGEDAPALYQTRHATQRQARLAQATWDDLARAFTALSQGNPPTSPKPSGGRPDAISPAASIKAGFERPGIELNGSTPDREHLWFDVHRFDGERAQGRLLNQPMFVPGLRRNDVRWIQRDQLSDWRLTIPHFQASFGPEHVKSMRQAVFVLKSQP